MAPKTSFSYKLTPEQQALLIDLIEHGNYRPMTVEHTIIAGATDDYNVALYKSGKCLVQGAGAADFVSFVLEPMVLGHAELGYEDVLHPELLDPHMGIDESGKGDFFGPLVAAAAYADAPLIKAMRELDVKDSKQISSDKKILSIARELRKLLGRRLSIVKIGPEAYNRLYSKMRNVNLILAWAHARAIENLLESVPECPRAVADQFGNERLITDALMKKGRRIELHQRHKAESDIAVAAASILARETFVLSLKKMETDFGMEIPKGASAAVREAAVRIAKERGPEILLQTVKCHFKVTDAVLGELGTDRKCLGPVGQATSRVQAWRHRRPHSSKIDAPAPSDGKRRHHAQ